MGAIMYNIIGSIIFLLGSFITWLSVIFYMTKKVIKIDFFKNMKNAITIYVLSGIGAMGLTMISYIIMCMIQTAV